MMYEMNCDEKEQSLIRTTKNLPCCVSIPIFFLPDQGDEGCTLSKFPDARFNLKSHTVLNFIYTPLAKLLAR